MTMQILKQREEEAKGEDSKEVDKIRKKKEMQRRITNRVGSDLGGNKRCRKREIEERIG